MPTQARCKSPVGTADKFASRLLPEKRGQAPQQAQEQRQCLLGNRVGKQPRSAGHQNLRTDDGRRKTVVEAGGGRLNPAQSPARDHFVPGHRDLGVTAKNVRLEDFPGNPFLARVDDLCLRGSLGNLPQMAWFQRITKDNAHAPILASGKPSTRWSGDLRVGQRISVHARWRKRGQSAIIARESKG